MDIIHIKKAELLLFRVLKHGHTSGYNLCWVNITTLHNPQLNHDIKWIEAVHGGVSSHSLMSPAVINSVNFISFPERSTRSLVSELPVRPHSVNYWINKTTLRGWIRPYLMFIFYSMVQLCGHWKNFRIYSRVYKLATIIFSSGITSIEKCIP